MTHAPCKLHRRALVAGLIASGPALAMSHDAPIRAALDRYVAAWTAGDREGIAACYHDDFVLHWFGRNGLSGEHRGKASALAALAEFTRRTRRRLLAVDAILTGPDRGALIAREALGPDAIPVERVLVYTIAGGLLKECWVYDQDQALIDRLVGTKGI